MKKTTLKIIATVLCLALLLPLAACGESKHKDIEFFAMDTIMDIRAYGNKAEEGMTAAQNVILTLDKMLDPENSASTVYAMNHAHGQSVAVSSQIAEMISVAKEIYANSGGALDLTVYPLVKAWGFLDEKYYVPAYNDIEYLLQFVDFSKVQLVSFPSSGTYQVTMPEGFEITFAACAKGCASQYAVETMRNHGVTSAWVSLGGNVQTLGLKPDGSNWAIGIQDPNNKESYVGVVSAGECAIVTSGNYQRSFVGSDGETYGHLLKPNTGYPVVNWLQSVTVICDNGIKADCLSTALFVLGQSQAIEYWKAHRDEFDMVLINTSNEVIITSGLIEKFTLANDNYKLSSIE